MKSIISGVVLLFLTTVCSAQTGDTSMYYYDTTHVDTTQYDYGSFSSSTYTQNPSELTPVKKEREQAYRERKFSKTEWKKIVGETNYSEEPTKEEEKKEEQAGHERSGAWNPATLKIIGFVLIILLIGVVIFLLLRNALRDEAVRKNSVNAETLLYDNHIDEVTESDLDRLLREALAKNDFRSAIRLYYIKLLKHLNSTGYIAWKKDKTNHDYAMEVSGSTFIREFRRLITAYEIIWYGERTPSPEEFKKLQANFAELQQQARINV